MMEVSPGIFKVTQKFKTRLFQFSANIYVITGKDGLVFDAGSIKGVRELIKNIKSIETTTGTQITRTLPSHTHWDHFSGLTDLHQRLGLTILATPRMVECFASLSAYRMTYRHQPFGPSRRTVPLMIKDLSVLFLDHLFYHLAGVKPVQSPVQAIRENSTLTINDQPWQVIHHPGHCDDHISLYQEETGILLGGDNILKSITTWLGPPRSNIDDYMNTLHRIKNLPGLKMILPAHGSIITNPVERIDSIIAHRNNRTDLIYTKLRRKGKGGSTGPQLLKSIYPSSTPSERYLSKGWIDLTLDHLVKHKKAVCLSQNGKKTYFAT